MEDMMDDCKEFRFLEVADLKLNKPGTVFVSIIHAVVEDGLSDGNLDEY